MNLLKHIVEQIEQGQFYDWTRDFDLFKNTLNSATESAKSRFEKSLSDKVLNKSVLVRASKGYKQPIKDYTIKRVTGVNINDFYDDWVVVLKNEFNKEFFLTAGYKIKVLGASVAAEPGAATAPEQPEPQNQQPPVASTPQPSQQTQPNPQTQPLKESNELTYLDNNFWILTSMQAKDLSIDGKLPQPGYEKRVNLSKLKNYVFKFRQNSSAVAIDPTQTKQAWIQQTLHRNKRVWAIRLYFNR